MMIDNMYGLAIQIALTLSTSLAVYFLLARSLGKLLDEVVMLPACTTFYTRLLGITLTLIALSSALEPRFDFEKTDKTMEYVWHFGDILSDNFGAISWFLAGYLLFITILAASLRRKRE